MKGLHASWVDFVVASKGTPCPSTAEERMHVPTGAIALGSPVKGDWPNYWTVTRPFIERFGGGTFEAVLFYGDGGVVVWTTTWVWTVRKFGYDEEHLLRLLRNPPDV